MNIPRKGSTSSRGRTRRGIFAAGAVSASLVVGGMAVPAVEAAPFPTRASTRSATPPKPDPHGLLATYYDATGVVLAVAARLGPDDLDAQAPKGAVSVVARGILIPSQQGAFAVTASSDTTVIIDGRRIEPGSSATVNLARDGNQIDIRHSLHGASPVSWSGPGITGSKPIDRDSLLTRDLNLPKPDDPFPAAPGSTSLWGSTRDDWPDEPVDTDRDGILDEWEVDGYTVEQSATGAIEVVAWNAEKHDGKNDIWGRPYVRYVTSPQKASTSNDPYSDFQKVTGIQMDPRVTALAQHPLVTAYPEVAIDMTQYRLIADTQWSSGSGGSNQKGVSQSTSSSRSSSDTVGGEVSCSASLLDFGCSVSLNYSTTTETSTSYEESTSNSSTSEWNSLLSGNNARAAIMLPNIFYDNVGTAPISNGYPLFTVKLGNESLVSATSNQANRLTAANPGETYPRGDTALAFEKVNDFGSVISFDKEAVDRLRDYKNSGKGDLEIVTTGMDAPVVLIDTTGQPYESSTAWEEQLSVIRNTTAELVVEGSDGQPVTRRVAAPGSSAVERTVPQLTVGEALALTHGAVKVGDHYEIDGVAVTPQTHDVITDATTATEIKQQGIKSIFDAKLKAGMSITFNRVVEKPEPGAPTFTARLIARFGGGTTGCGGDAPSCMLELHPQDTVATCNLNDAQTDEHFTLKVGDFGTFSPYCLSGAEEPYLFVPVFWPDHPSSVPPPGTPLTLSRDGVTYKTIPMPEVELDGKTRSASGSR